MFFWSLFTHPLLDCFTPYGTQLFAPFSSYRVAFNNIAVADPLYTVPFLLSMIVLLFYKRQSNKRRLWLKIGVGVSSVYMMFTVFNKVHIDQVFKNYLAQKGLNYNRFSTQPSILNNLLWYGIAETDSTYQVAYYSLFDESHKFSEWKIFPKKRGLQIDDYKDLRCLAWFSNNYYNIESLGNGDYTYKDLRNPLVETRDGYQALFSLELYTLDKRLDMKPFAPQIDDLKFTMSALWARLKGIN
ncbi:MAG: inner membrane protein [Psychroserpens sp.]